MNESRPSIHQRLSRLTEFLSDGWPEAISQFRRVEAPVTNLLLSVTLGIFLCQLILSVLWNATSIQALNAYLFIEVPMLMWPLAIFLHRDFLTHFLPNILFLVLLGRVVESRLKKRWFAVFFVLTAVVTIAVGAYLTLLEATKPNIAFYGMSGFVYALCGFSLAHFLLHDDLLSMEYGSVLFGATGVALVLVNLGRGIWMLSLEPINGGHLSGVIIGSFTAIWLAYLCS